MLSIVATPIGNLSDITLRALDVLKAADEIICEDTRHTGILLQHFGIQKPLMRLNDFNEQHEFPRILSKLIEGKNLALVSDAGTPLISDPGYKLVRACIEAGIPVDSLPGPVSPIVALTLSGLPPDKFFFLGYLPEKPGQCATMLAKIKTIASTIKTTFIAFVAPHKLIKTLVWMQTAYGNIDVSLAKELTKINQRVETHSLEQWQQIFTKQPPRGEYILLFSL